MTSTEIDRPNNIPAAPAPHHVGQATAIEQARAVAEVQAAIIVAQQCPRSVPTAIAAMAESCAQMGLAERAFFRYNRAGSQITGASVHLARELARCWGNIQYGIGELRRDDVKGESEMIAWAWDVQTNARSSTTFIVKHGRDTKQGIKSLVELRDVYENNANMGARRLREQIFAVLPVWFTEDAKQRANATIEKGAGDKPLPQRIADNIRGFEGLGVAVDQLEQKLGRSRDKWTAHDVAQLVVVGRSLRNGETTVEDEFPLERTTADEFGVGPAAQPATRGRGKAKPAQSDGGDGPTEEDIAAMNAEAAREAAERETAAAGSGLFGGGS